MTSARALALEAVRRVVDEGAYSNVLIPALLSRSALDERDRAFAAELAYGTLRRLVTLDAVVEEASGRGVDRMSAGARHALRLGAHQLLDMRVPAHAAVGETVDLVSAKERGFVNAVLRKIGRSAPAPPEGAGERDIALRTGMAPWAVRELRALLGDDAETAASALASRGALSLRANACRAGAGDLESTLEAAGRSPRRGEVDPECLLLDGGDPLSLPGWKEGLFAVQDQASAFVVRTLDPRPGGSVLDVCAAPGGKALMASCLVGEAGSVVAADVREQRVGLIRREALRLGLMPQLLVQDATRPGIRGGFDRVLVDAPCSGIGSARRRPELLWRVRKDALVGLAARQLEIASAAAGLLPPGGRLVYSVCTFPRVETDAVCDSLLRRHPDLTELATRGPDGELRIRHRLWPHLHGCDGMFVAAFEKGA
jgi:16S rRNA (cytosine967-C5)-methyltransferase